MKQRQRSQKGCVSIDRQNWVCRWRENVPDGNGGIVRKLRFKVLGPVTAEHRRNKDRKSGKLRIPDDIQQQADKIAGAANSSNMSVLATIEQFVDSIYLPEKKQALKPGSYEALSWRWDYYLKKRIGECVLRDYQRKDAALLWRDIQKDHDLGSQSLRHIRFTLRGIFETAKDHGLFYGENPASASLPPNLRGKAETGVYTVREVNRLLKLFPSPLAQALFALAFGSGLRKGEMAGLEWPNYRPTDEGATIRVRQSVYRGHVSTPKTESSADDVEIGPEIVEYVEAYRRFLSGVNEGYMFPGEKDRSTNKVRPINLDSFWRWKINPLLTRCGICHEAKSAHPKADHEYKRDESMPVWKGWHGFRRGAATEAAKKLSNGGTEAASLLLRHSDVGVTEDRYIKNSKQDKRTREAQKIINIQRQRQRAARAISAGLREAVN